MTKEVFKRFLELQTSSVINMTGIVRGAELCGISEDEYEDCLWNYGKYKAMLINNELK